MNPNIEATMKWIDTVGAKLGELGGKTFHYMVSHTIAEAWCNMMVFGTVGIVLFIVSFVFYKKSKTDDDFLHPAVMLGVVSFIITAASVAGNLPDILAPEGATINKISKSFNK